MSEPKVIEESPRGTLYIFEWDFGAPGTGRGVDAYYTEDPQPAAVAIEQGLPDSKRRALEIEARACFRDPPPTGRKVLWTAGSLEEVDSHRVRRLRPIIEEEAPDWVEAVSIAADVYGEDEASVAFWSGVPLEPALAILENLEQ